MNDYNSFNLNQDVSNYFILKVDANSWNQVNQDLFELGENSGWQNGQYSISEVLVYNHILAPDQQNQVGGFLAAEYGLTTAYPQGLPTTIIPDGSDVSVAAGATFDVNGNNEQIKSIVGPVGSNVTLGANTGILTFVGSNTAEFDGAISGAGSIARQGAGTEILTGNNSYTGATTVSGAGTLQVDGVQTGAGAVSVVNGGLLVGTGTLPGPVTVGDVNTTVAQAADGTLKPGDVGQIGAMNTGSATFTANLFSHGNYEAVSSPGSYDQLHITGTLTLGNVGAHFFPTLDLQPATGLPNGSSYTIITTTGGVSGQFFGLPEGGLFSVNSETFQISYLNNNVTVTKVTSGPTIYVDPTFSAANPNIQDADPVVPGDQNATFGVNAFNSVNAAIAAAGNLSTIVVNPGTYHEDVNVNKTVLLYLQADTDFNDQNIAWDSLASPSNVSPFIQLNGGVILTAGGDNHSTTLNAPIFWHGSFVKAGSGSMTLAAANGYDGTTTVNDNGALVTGVAFALPSGTIDIGANAQVQLDGINQSFASLAGTGTINDSITAPATASDATLTIGDGNVNTAFQGVLADGISGHKLLLDKIGTGTFTLGGSVSTFSGGTNVIGGILQAGAANAFSVNSVMTAGPDGDLQLNGNSSTVLDLTGTGIVKNASTTTAATLTVTTDNVGSTFGGLIEDGAGANPLALAKTGGPGVFILNTSNTYTGGTLIENGKVRLGSENTNLLSFGNVDVGANGILQMAGYDLTIGGLTGSGIVENDAANNVTLTIGVIINSTFSGTLRDGANTGALSVVLDSPISAPQGNGFAAYGSVQINDNDLNLNGNGGLFNHGNPTTFSNYYGTTIVTGGPSGNGLLYQQPQDWINEGLTNSPNNFETLYLADLYVSPANTGVWTFQSSNIDDRAGMWIDLNQDGVLGTAGAGLGDGNGGPEQLAWQDGGNRQVTLATGTYLVAFTYGQYGGGTQVEFNFQSPTMASEATVNPAAPSQAGLWTAIAPNQASLTLTGNNTYTGTTMVQQGTLVAGSNNALGATSAGTTVDLGGTLGFANGATVSESIVANGMGATDEPGAIVNISGNNLLTTTLVAPTIPALGQLGVGSVAGTLTLNAIDLANDNLVFNGPAGGVAVNGTVFGQGRSPATSPVMANLEAWYQASNTASLNGGSVTDGQQVTEWDDLTGNGHTATTGNGAAVYSATGGPSGTPTVQFNDSSLNIAGSMTAAEEFIVLKSNYASSSFGSDWGSPFGAQDGQNWMIQGNTEQFWGGYYPAAVAVNSVSVPNNNNFDLNQAGPNGQLNVSHYFVLQVDANNWNQVNQDLFELGQNSGWQNGQYSISEVLVYNQVLSPADQAAVNAYLQNEYQISMGTINIPTNAIVKNGASTDTLNGNNTNIGSTTVNAGVLVVNGNNSYSGTTTVNGGMLVAGNSGALGTNPAGVTVNVGGTLGLQNSITLTSAVTADGTGTAGQPGALVNVSGDNTYSGALTVVDSGDHAIGIGSDAGTLSIPNAFNMGDSNLTVGGAGNVDFQNTISGTIGTGPTSPNMTDLEAWFDASNAASINGGSVSDGQQVTQWNDLTGHGHTATTGDSTVTYAATGGPNGLPALEFPNNSSLHIAGSMTAAEEFIVLNSNFSNYAFAGGDWGSPFGAEDGNNWMFQSNSEQFWGDGNHIPMAVAVNGASVPSNNNFDLNQAGPNGQFDVSQYFILKVDANNWNQVNADLFKLGENGGWVQGQYGIAEVLVYNQVQSPANDALTEAYLQSKYDVGQGSNSVTKAGAGTVTLDHANTFGGTTTVNGGVLLVNNPHAVQGSPSITVTSGGTLGLGGGVDITSPLTIAGAGNNGVGAIDNVAGANTIDSNILLADDATIGSDSGTLTINGTFTTPPVQTDFSLDPLTNAEAAAGKNLFFTGAGDTIVTSSLQGQSGGFTLTPGQLIGNYYAGIPNDQRGTVLNPGDTNEFLGNLTPGVTAPLTAPVNFLDISDNGFYNYSDNVQYAGPSNYQIFTGALWYGAVTIPLTSSGNITFYTSSDDGSDLWIDGNLVVDNDYNQGNTQRQGSISLAPGSTHSIVVGYYQGVGGANINASWDIGDGSGEVLIPASAFSSVSPSGGGVGSVTMNGTGKVTLEGDSSNFTGATTVNHGTLLVDNTSGFGTAGNVVVDGGVLAGNGSVAGSVSGDPTLGSGTVSAGDPGSTGILTVGSLTFTPGSALGASTGALSIVANGATTAGADYDQIVVPSGPIILGSAGQYPTLNFDPTVNLGVGTTITIIRNESGTSISGQFADLPDQAVFMANGQAFQISYQGNGENDVTLTATQAGHLTPTSTSLTDHGPNPSALNQAVSFTGTVSAGVPDGDTITLEQSSTSGGPYTAFDTTTTLGGVFSFSESGLAVGTHYIVAVYGGDATYAMSTSSQVTQVVPPTITVVVINQDISALYNAPGQPSAGSQRSMVNDIVYTFNAPVNITSSALDPNVFTIAIASNPFGYSGTLPTLSWAPVAGSGGTEWAVTFSGAGTTAGSIANGVYTITVNHTSAIVAASDSTPLQLQASGIDSATQSFFRLFGDINGDKVVNNADNIRFKQALTTYNAAFDFNQDGAVNNADNVRFKQALSISFTGFTNTI